MKRKKSLLGLKFLLVWTIWPLAISKFQREAIVGRCGDTGEQGSFDLTGELRRKLKSLSQRHNLVSVLHIPY